MSSSMWQQISLYGCVLMLSSRKYDVCCYEYWIAGWVYGWLGSFSLLRACVYATEPFTWRSTCTFPMLHLAYSWHLWWCTHAAEGMDLRTQCLYAYWQHCLPFTPGCWPVFSCTVYTVYACLILHSIQLYMYIVTIMHMCASSYWKRNWQGNTHMNDPFLCFLGLLINTSIGVTHSYLVV